MKRLVCLLCVLCLCCSQAMANEKGTMKLWNAGGEADFWRKHPEIPHESVWYDPWGNKLEGVKETQADVIMLALHSEDMQLFADAEMMADLSSSAVISNAVSRMPAWVRQRVTTEDGRILALPLVALPRPFYWYQDAWDAAGLTAEDVPDSFEALLDFLNKWVERTRKKPEKNVCVTRMIRWDTGQEKYNYMHWLMELLLLSHEMQQRHAGEAVSFDTPAFIHLANRVRETGQALYEAEPKQSKRQKMLQLFQSDIHGGEHANGGRAYGMSHTVPLRLTREQPALSYLSMEVVFVRQGSAWRDESIALLESLLKDRPWWFCYSMYTDFAAGDYAYDSNRTGYVDAGWLKDYHSYDGLFVSCPCVFHQTCGGLTNKEALLMQFYQGSITSEALAKGLL